MTDNFEKDSIVLRAKTRWNNKTREERVRKSYKYKFLETKFKKPFHDWGDAFDRLTKTQRNILIKGELIRTYDSLSNERKTKIKKDFNLDNFSSKWYKLVPSDKKKLLNYVIG